MPTEPTPEEGTEARPEPLFPPAEPFPPEDDEDDLEGDDDDEETIVIDPKRVRGPGASDV